jgi:O-antigen/teichoic acid export membrane protein
MTSRVTTGRQWCYLPLLAIATALLLAKSFAYARLFGVSQFGLFSQCLLIGNAAALFCGLGMQWVAQKQWPQHAAMQKSTRVDASVALALFVGMILTAGGFLAVLVAFMMGQLASPAAFLSLPVFSLSQYLFTVGVTSVRSELDFLRFARLSVGRASLTAVLGLGVAALSDDVAAVLLTEAVATALIGMNALGGGRLMRVAGLVRTSSVIVETARLEMPSAIRLLALSAISYALFNLDRWIGVMTLSSSAYGTYAAGALVLLAFDTLQAMLNVAVQPLMARRLATGDSRWVIRFAHACTAATIGVGAVACVPLITALQWTVLRVLPGFEGSLTVISILVPAGFLRLADFYGTLAILRDREIVLAGGAIGICLIALVSVVLASRSGMVFTPIRLSVLALTLTIGAFVLRACVACFPEKQDAHA